MSTITPTSDQRRTLNCTTFQVGDSVQSTLDGKIGTVVTPDGLIDGVPVALPPVPTATPAPPTTLIVKVQWTDGTSSDIALSALRRWP